MKLYKLYVAKPLLAIYLLILGAWVLAGPALMIAAAVGAFGTDGPPAWIFTILLAFGLFNAYWWLRIPFEIAIRDDSAVEFRNIFRRTTVSPSEIKSIRAKPYTLGFVDVVHQGGTVHLLNQMDGFHDFIATVESLNPAVKIKGC